MGHCLSLNRESNRNDKSPKGNNDLSDLNPKNVPSFPWLDKEVIVFIYSVYDGDTVKVLLNYNNNLFKFSIRILGIDCPEVSRCSSSEKEAGIIVRDYLRKRLERTSAKFYATGWDKYGGRILGHIYFLNGESVSENLIEKGYAKPYSGKTAKEPWTEDEHWKIKNS